MLLHICTFYLHILCVRWLFPGRSGMLLKWRQLVIDCWLRLNLFNLLWGKKVNLICKYVILHLPPVYRDISQHSLNLIVLSATIWFAVLLGGGTRSLGWSAAYLYERCLPPWALPFRHYHGKDAHAHVLQYFQAMNCGNLKWSVCWS